MIEHSRVLVAEDEPLIRALVSLAFEAEGYDVDTAADGAEALAKACQQPPQAIVLDLMMPVMNGWDFLAAWQCQPTSQAVPRSGHLSWLSPGRPPTPRRAGVPHQAVRHRPTRCHGIRAGRSKRVALRRQGAGFSQGSTSSCSICSPGHDRILVS
jgi:hypothetical protein